MMHFFTKKHLLLLLFFSIGVMLSIFLASSLNEKIIEYEDVLMKIELESKYSTFVSDMKVMKGQVEFLKSESPKLIFLLGVFVSVAFTVLIWFYQQLFNKKEELRKARNEIFATNLVLQKKNKELEEYTYVVAHDLQEPLNTINGFVEVLQEDHPSLFDNQEVEQHITLISSTSSRMRMMIKELLLYTKLGKNRKPELVNIREIVDEILIDLTNLVKKSDVIINLPEDFPKIKGYRLELKLLFQNLIINAIKYQKRDVRPIVDIFFRDNALENKFTIQDNGIGIEEKHKETIFKIFHRLHHSSKYSGSGIGLTKCKKILELHKGLIWVESTIGQGSKFHFTIPK